MRSHQGHKVQQLACGPAVRSQDARQRWSKEDRTGPDKAAAEERSDLGLSNRLDVLVRPLAHPEIEPKDRPAGLQHPNHFASKIPLHLVAQNRGKSLKLRYDIEVFVRPGERAGAAGTEVGLRQPPFGAIDPVAREIDSRHQGGISITLRKL
jgi:hypothetical protein